MEQTVIVGSGFGGSVTAYRLAMAGHKVLLLERGKSYPPGSFTRTVPGVRDSFWDPSANLYGRYNVWFFRQLGAFVCSGLGGGSLIYANVLLRKPRSWFEGWPISYDDLEPHYTEVEKILLPTEYPLRGEYDVPKVRQFRLAAERIAAADPAKRMTVIRPPVAITFAPVGDPLGEQFDKGENLHGIPRRTCTLCGDCMAGCNNGAKNTLDFNYLSLAKATGNLEIKTLTEVCAFRRHSTDELEVDFFEHAPGETPARGPTQTVRTKRLVLCAGTFGSTYLMLQHAPALGEVNGLGGKFSSNGDQLAFAIECDRDISAMTGPNITTALQGDDFYIEDAGIPREVAWLAEGMSLLGWAKRGVRLFCQMARKMWGSDDDPDFGAELSQLVGNAELSSRFMPLLAMGRDAPAGNFSLKPRGGNKAPYLALDWDSSASAAYFERITKVMRQFAKELGGKFQLNLPTALFSREVTVHPLGGCPMGTTKDNSVVDSHGKAWVHPALWVVDGSILPTAVGANPSLTIAAVANRAADRMLGIA